MKKIVLFSLQVVAFSLALPILYMLSLLVAVVILYIFRVPFLGNIFPWVLGTAIYLGLMPYTMRWVCYSIFIISLVILEEEETMKLLESSIIVFSKIYQFCSGIGILGGFTALLFQVFQLMRTNNGHDDLAAIGITVASLLPVCLILALLLARSAQVFNRSFADEGEEILNEKPW